MLQTPGKPQTQSKSQSLGVFSETGSPDSGQSTWGGKQKCGACLQHSPSDTVISSSEQ